MGRREALGSIPWGQCWAHRQHHSVGKERKDEDNRVRLGVGASKDEAP